MSNPSLLYQTALAMSPSGSLTGLSPTAMQASVSPTGGAGLGTFDPTQSVSMQGYQGNVPLPPPRPSALALNTPQALTGGGDTPQTPPPSQAPQAPQAAPTQSPATQSSPLGSLGSFFSNGVLGNSTGSTQGVSSSTGNPFNTQDPHSFVSKLFGPAGTANQQPLVSPNSIVGRLAHLFMN